MKWNPLDFVFWGIILVLVACVLIILFSKENKRLVWTFQKKLEILWNYNKLGKIH